MAKRLRFSLIGILTVLLCFVFSFGLLGFSTAKAADGQAIELSEVTDFEYDSAETTKLLGLSETGNAKIRDAATYSIVVPDTVTEIAEGAFKSLGGVISIRLPFMGAKANLSEDEVKAGKGTLGYIFGSGNFLGASSTVFVVDSEESGDGTYYPQGIPKEKQTFVTYQVPNNLQTVTVTGDTLYHGAFSNCFGIKNVSILNVTTIPALAFSECHDLKNIDVSTELAEIGRRAFYNTRTLESIALSIVEKIGVYAFFNSGLLTVNLPSNLGTDGLGAFAFQNCQQLVSLTINDGVSIPFAKSSYSGELDHAFVICRRLSEIIDLRTAPTELSQISDWTGLLRDVSVHETEEERNVDTPLKEIRTTNESGIKNITTEYGTFVFHQLQSDGKIYLCNVEPNGDTVILPEASQLTDMGAQSYEISPYCFTYNSIPQIMIPRSVSKIGKAAFARIGFDLLCLGYPQDDTQTCHIEFGTNQEAFLGIVSVNTLQNYTDTPVTTVTQNNYDVKNIDGYHFYRGNDVEGNERIILTGYDKNVVKGDIVLPSGERVGSAYGDKDYIAYEIGVMALYSDKDITSVRIPAAVTQIHDYALALNYRLTSIVVDGNALEYIGPAAFYMDTSLETVALPDSVYEIGSSAFHGCSSLTNFTLPASLETWGNNYDYDSHRYGFGEIFYGCTSLQSITIPANLKVIRERAFYNCTNLKEVKFADGCVVNSINSQAFYGTAITSLVIPKSVNFVNNGAFDNMSSLKQIYFEDGSKLTATTQKDWFDDSVQLESFNISNTYNHSNMRSPLNFTETGTGRNLLENNIKNATVFLPKEKNAAGSWIISFTLISGFSDAKFIVAPDKKTYDTIMGLKNANASAALQANLDAARAKLYWQTEITFEAKNGDKVEYITQKKLASNDGASIKYTLIEDADGRPYSWVYDENYTLPSDVGSFAADPNAWKAADDSTITSDFVVTEDGLKFTEVATNIVDPKDERLEYSGNPYVLSRSGYELVSVVDASNNASPAIEVGKYKVTVKPAAGCVWLDGGDQEKFFELEIYKKKVTLEWMYNQNEPIRGGTYEIGYYDGLNVNLFGARSRSDNLELGVNKGLVAIKDGDVTATPQTALTVGLYKLTVTDANYEFTNGTLYVRVNPAVMKTDAMIGIPAFKYTVGDSNYDFNSGMLYIYKKKADNTVVPSFKQLSADDYTLVEVIQGASVARYRNEQITCVLNVNENAIAGVDNTVVTGDKQNGIGKYTTVYRFTARENYEFGLGSLKPDGYTVELSSDNKTLTISKVWYIVQLDNALLMSDATSENDIYRIESWTYGDAKEFTLPRLMHGDESETGWQEDDTRVSFSLTLTRDSKTETIAAAKTPRSELLDYLNRFMPAGEYTLTFEVEGFDYDTPHTNWWNGAETEAQTYPKFSRVCEFRVEKAAIILDDTKLPKDIQTGYLDYRWKIDADRSQFFAAFETAIGADGVILTEDLEAPNTVYWFNKEEYFGDYSVSYNFARLNSDDYSASNHNDLLNEIKVDARATYTVYFQIKKPNHKPLTEVGEAGRYGYFFTVTVYDTQEIPTVNDAGLVYTGTRLYPEIAESVRYETVWEPTDDYILGGEHTVSFKLNDIEHYRWIDAEGEELEGDTVSVTFNIAQADNAFIVALNMLGWNFGGYDKDINSIRGAAKFLDEGESIRFRVVKSGETEPVKGLADFGADADGRVTDDKVVEALNSLGKGIYKLYALVAETANYKVLERNVEFEVKYGVNTWSVTPNVMQWKYDSYDKTVNLILGEAKIKDENNPAVFKVTSDAKGETVLIDDFSLVNGVVPDAVATKLAALKVGTYYLWSSVAETEFYSKLQPDEPFEFAVSKALNDWTEALDVIGWAYGDYDKQTNRVLGAVVSGEITFSVSKGETVIKGLESFTSVTDTIAAVLAALDVGEYTLSATVTVDSDHEQPAPQKISFSVEQGANDWKVPFDVIGWKFGGFDKDTNRFMGEVLHGSVKFSVSKGDTVIKGLEGFASVDDTIAAILAGLGAGDYSVKATVTADANYMSVTDGSGTLTVAKAGNEWVVSLGITTWIEGKFGSLEEFPIVVDPKFGTAKIKIVDSNNAEKVYYEGENGTDELKEILAKLEVGNYILTASVEASVDYYALAADPIVFRVFEKPGLPWWAVLLIVIGSLGVAALILWILHEKGVLQMLTGRIVIAMRTRMTVDATIAAVRANKRAEEARKSVAKAELQDRLEAARKAREEERNKPPEERAAALEEKAAAEAAKAEKLQQRADRMKKQANRLKTKENNAAEAETPEAEAETPETEVPENETPVAEAPNEANEAPETEAEAPNETTEATEATETADDGAENTEAAATEATDDTNTTDEE